MRYPMTVSALILAGLLTAVTAAQAQLPGGMSMPGVGSLPTGGFSKASLLQQAQELLSDLTSMKSAGTLAPAQAKEVDGLLPKAESLKGELEKPQVEPMRLPQLATDLSDLQKQASMLKGFMK
jgi:hypothetical protein